jgi:hypothetical protein
MFEGATARRLDFGGITTTATVAVAGGRPRGSLRLATPGRAAGGADKYRQLDLRRRRAQIAARHLLDLLADEC